jgi:hypothetical protein
MRDVPVLKGSDDDMLFDLWISSIVYYCAQNIAFQKLDLLLSSVEKLGRQLLSFVGESDRD